MSSLEPITRKEQYLNRLTGEEQAIPDEPITRIEQYLARLCGEETEIPSSPITREEAYLAYLNGEDVTLPEPITRLEQFMAFAASKSETKPTPLTREEFYWDKYQGGAVLKDFPDLPASIVTVTDAIAKPLDSLKVAITPVQAGSRDPSPDNIRPISGWMGAEVQRTGKNIWKYGDISGRRVATINAPDIPVGNYTISTEITSEDTDRNISTIYVVFDNQTSETFRLDRNQRVSVQLVVSNKIKEINFYASRNYSESEGDVFKFSNIQIEAGNQATTYEPYTGTTYPITFPSEAGTVYGGTLDVTNGTLTVTKANIASYDGETLPGAWISDRDVYAEGTTPTTGAQVVYDLATPITYQLTPTEVQMLLGTNNIWADTGDILEGKYWGKKSSATRQMLSTLRDAGEITDTTPTEENDER